MIKHHSTKIVPLTRELVDNTLHAPRCKGERKLQRKRLGFLGKRLTEGLFYPPRWSFASFNGTRYRMNGQHSSKILSEASEELFPHDMVAIIDEFQVDNDQDLADLFAQFDAKASSRTRGEVVNAHGRIHTEYEGLSQTQLTACATGIVYGLLNGEEVRTIPDEDRGRYLHEYVDFVIWVNEFIKVRKLLRGPVIGAMFRTYASDKYAALTFWRWVRDENHPQVTHSTRVLAEFLKMYPDKKHKKAFAWNSRAFYVKCLHAWNAYRAGTITVLKYHCNAPIPKVL